MDDPPDSPFPKEREAIKCSICGHNNFRKCKCPWDKIFQEWPAKYAPILKELSWEEWADEPK